MDINTLLSSMASVVAILTFILELYKITSDKKDNKNSSNTITIDNSINLNSNNTNSYSFDSHDKNIKTYPVNSYTNHPNKKVQSSNNSNDFGVYIFLFILIGFLLSKVYLDNQPLIIFWLIILGILSFIITLICTLILAKNKLITNSTLYLHTIKWPPLFTGIIFIYRPLYSSNNLSLVEELIKKGTGYLETFLNYPSDSLFFIFQVSGLILTALVFINYLLYIVINTYKSLKTKTPLKTISWKDTIPYFLMLIFIFVLVSGLYIKLLNLRPQIDYHL
jgi:hypothetical protein